jgi:hypothetical protein
MCSHIQGALQMRENAHAKAKGTTARAVPLSTATAIRDAGKAKTASTAHKALIDCAYSDFRYNVVRPVAKAAVERDSIVITAQMRALLTQLDALCTTYPEMRNVCSAYISEASK